MISDYIKGIQALILDMDGVLWRDTEPLGDLPRLFELLKAQGYQVQFVTNNATKTIKEYVDKLSEFGVQSSSTQILSAAEATGIFLKNKFPSQTKVYVIGQPSLKCTLSKYDMDIVDESEQDVQVVVASIDYDLTYKKLKHASLLIQEGCFFVGTNPDRTLPTPEGFIPGSGTVIEALEIASGKSAKFIGKPEPLLYEIALSRLGTSPQVTLAVGDRLETDIAGAQAAGIHTALVLTGASSMEQAYGFSPNPDIIAESFEALIR